MEYPKNQCPHCGKSFAQGMHMHIRKCAREHRGTATVTVNGSDPRAVLELAVSSLRHQAATLETKIQSTHDMEEELKNIRQAIIGLETSLSRFPGGPPLP